MVVPRSLSQYGGVVCYRLSRSPTLGILRLFASSGFGVGRWRLQPWSKCRHLREARGERKCREGNVHQQFKSRCFYPCPINNLNITRRLPPRRPAAIADTLYQNSKCNGIVDTLCARKKNLYSYIMWRKQLMVRSRFPTSV